MARNILHEAEQHLAVVVASDDIGFEVLLSLQKLKTGAPLPSTFFCFDFFS